MLDNATFPALIPVFQPLWSLNGTEAGWVSGIYYAGYAAAVPLLVTMTDRFDARAVYLACCLAGGVAALAFAFLAGPVAGPAVSPHRRGQPPRPPHGRPHRQ